MTGDRELFNQQLARIHGDRNAATVWTCAALERRIEAYQREIGRLRDLQTLFYTGRYFVWKIPETYLPEDAVIVDRMRED